jgi:hypothetical protein
MGDWLKVEFWAQLPDGMKVAQVDRHRVDAELSRLFGFSRVTGLTISEVNDGQAPRVLNLVDDRPSEGNPIYPSS